MDESTSTDVFPPFGVQKGNFEMFHVPFKNIDIFLMNHPSSITLYNHLSVEVLSGSVSIFGYLIDSKSPALNVFSSEKTGLIEMKTASSDSIWKDEEEYINLRYIIQSIFDNDKKTRNLMGKILSTTVVVLAKLIAIPMNLCFLEQYFPCLVKFELYKSKIRHMMHVADYCDKLPISFGAQEEKLFYEINALIRNSVFEKPNNQRIVVCGAKNTGKSSLIRFLINKLLKEYPEVCHLETDSGQTEFTPPGVFSLTTITEPVIGPPFFQQKKPVSMVFTGSTSPTSPIVCARAIKKLMKLYGEKFEKIPLLVNTNGWMENIGLGCLGNVIKIVKPTVLVEIVAEDEDNMFDYREFMPADCSYFQIRCSHNTKNSYYTGKQLREISLLSYFSACHKNKFVRPGPLNKVKEVISVSLEKIAVYLYHQKVLPNRMFEAIINSIVALCSVEESDVLESNIPLFPKTLREDPICECLGYGLVTAIDEAKMLMYMISPLSAEELKNVKAVIKGNIAVPDTLILNQKIYETEIPFTDVREINDNFDEEIEDYSMVSLKSFSETSGFATPRASPSIALASPHSYSRKISKRSGRYKT